MPRGMAPRKERGAFWERRDQASPAQVRGQRGARCYRQARSICIFNEFLQPPGREEAGVAFTLFLWHVRSVHLHGHGPHPSHHHLLENQPLSCTASLNPRVPPSLPPAHAQVTLPPKGSFRKKSAFLSSLPAGNVSVTSPPHL